MLCKDATAVLTEFHINGVHPMKNMHSQNDFCSKSTKDCSSWKSLGTVHFEFAISFQHEFISPSKAYCTCTITQLRWTCAVDLRTSDYVCLLVNHWPIICSQTLALLLIALITKIRSSFQWLWSLKFQLHGIWCYWSGWCEDELWHDVKLRMHGVVLAFNAIHVCSLLHVPERLTDTVPVSIITVHTVHTLLSDDKQAKAQCLKQVIDYI